MFAVGDLIDGRYEVRGLLGSGGQGDVLEVFDHHERDVVALKLLRPTNHPFGVWGEAQILRHLVDDHILPIRNADTHLGQPFLVTAIATEGTIGGRIPSVGFDVAQAVRWIQQACQGIERGHDCGLLHNDIKPDNLFLDGRGNCLVGDFGMAGQIDPTGAGIAHGGTAATVAPEVAQAVVAGEPPYATRRSDVYSLAATLFHLLTGEPPHQFVGLAEDDHLKHVATTLPRKIRDVAPHVPDSLARAVNAALSVDPESRPATAIEFANSIGRPIVGRRWQRTDEHGGHIACHRGVRSGRTDYLLCTLAGAKPTDRKLITTHAENNRKVANGTVETTRARWAATVRKLMDRLS
ncbi:serine/threonine protein kinase [Flexivirga sp. ID2601S]|uniref:non-specific serine/threonine protein kinase n=1 Tax=Flexivirga aerilata TaxID=1656889 RepID=A0A849AAW6_9MICO|nr:serine/threonine protein kinase [Flexivirga aerilata]